MDIDGTPFGVDDDLLQLRRRQRERLASIPDFVFRDLTLPPIDPTTGPLRLAVERELRAVADTALEPAIEVLDESIESKVAAELFRLVSRAGGPMRVDDALEPTESQLEERRRATPPPRQFPEDVAIAMLAALVLFDIADQLAGDGYRDPRLL